MNTSKEAAGLRPIVVTVQEAALLMGLGKSKIYDLMDAGRLDYVKIDSVRRIPMDAICEFIERHRIAARKS